MPCGKASARKSDIQDGNDEQNEHQDAHLEGKHLGCRHPTSQEVIPQPKYDVGSPQQQRGAGNQPEQQREVTRQVSARCAADGVLESGGLCAVHGDQSATVVALERRNRARLTRSIQVFLDTLLDQLKIAVQPVVTELHPGSARCLLGSIGNLAA